MRGEPTLYIEHGIDTQNHPPVAVPLYRVSPARKDILNDEINRLLNERIIEPCESPYAAPVVLVPKPIGSFRLCIDYRKLNSVTKTDAYPLPRIDDLLQITKHTQYMSTIDLKAGYHQMNVTVSDETKRLSPVLSALIDLFACPLE
ncbi:Transposon Ty3-I Gag-Pol polyprotein [Araneus ventricosus]|uniref:Transposon Ty3-I Gag-Pol polyprotein n=1 Tax=Araneus ventricosus TaxID=182803 RepID=A0A4Y2GBS3_ARAVE|nr:Transposon Ty3-I Gag-Pol polyprotein [Araneus ventricosus]